MKVTITGRIEKRDLGIVTWVLVAEGGETYELLEPPPTLCQSGMKVRVEGQIREDVMTLAMVGPVLKVTSFEVGKN
jgi:hypothetical protein